MSDRPPFDPASLSKGIKVAAIGISATVLALFSYYMYRKFSRSARNTSSSSDDGEDALLKALTKKGALKSSSSP
jgi:hypothetical protein